MSIEKPFQNNSNSESQNPKQERAVEKERTVRPLSPEEQVGLGDYVRKLRAENNQE